MRAMVVVLSILLWASPTLAEQKSPDGFGPIKFGMTKEEAWEAIDGNGEWLLQDKVLQYSIELPTYSLNMKEFDVKQSFHEGIATDVEVKVNAEHDNFLTCITMHADVVAYLSNLYEKTPIYSENTEPGSLTKRYVGYNFAFDDGARIVTYLLLYRLPNGDEDCNFHIYLDSVSSLKNRKSPEQLLPF